MWSVAHADGQLVPHENIRANLRAKAAAGG
jgi:hypothetical protein